MKYKYYVNELFSIIVFDKSGTTQGQTSSRGIFFGFRILSVQRCFAKHL